MSSSGTLRKCQAGCPKKRRGDKEERRVQLGMVYPEFGKMVPGPVNETARLTGLDVFFQLGDLNAQRDALFSGHADSCVFRF